MNALQAPGSLVHPLIYQGRHPMPNARHCYWNISARRSIRRDLSTSNMSRQITTGGAKPVEEFNITSRGDSCEKRVASTVALAGPLLVCLERTALEQENERISLLFFVYLFAPAQANKTKGNLHKRRLDPWPCKLRQRPLRRRRNKPIPTEAPRSRALCRGPCRPRRQPGRLGSKKEQ